jgi:N-acetylglucosaminyldiphosphoundecaprenol N-acetyl-beta-D-mannosaminyltransferase
MKIESSADGGFSSASESYLEHCYVLGQRVDATSYIDATKRVLKWANRGQSKYVCVTNVHVVMEGWDSPSYRNMINSSDLITADGMPLVWALRWSGIRSATRVYGPDLTLHICKAAARQGLPIGLYGGTDRSLKTFVDVLKQRYPCIEVACAIAPPYRPLTAQEELAYTKQIKESGARILFVGIGCPKQERWMFEHQGVLQMPMLGVGAAFDFHSGKIRQAPSWIQQWGMEWFFRLMMEPKRLWRRYLWHNSRFLFFSIQQYLKLK